MATREDDFVISVDSGGTFSDCVIIDRSGTVTTGKASSTPDDFSVGVLDSITIAAERLGLASADVLGRAILFSHGTTVATNALLERKGDRTALAITQGFADALRIAYQNRPKLFERRIVLPEPLYERVVEVDERIGARGEILRSLDP